MLIVFAVLVICACSWLMADRDKWRLRCMGKTYCCTVRRVLAYATVQKEKEDTTCVFLRVPSLHLSGTRWLIKRGNEAVIKAVKASPDRPVAAYYYTRLGQEWLDIPGDWYSFAHIDTELLLNGEPFESEEQELRLNTFAQNTRFWGALVSLVAGTVCMAFAPAVTLIIAAVELFNNLNNVPLAGAKPQEKCVVKKDADIKDITEAHEANPAETPSDYDTWTDAQKEIYRLQKKVLAQKKIAKAQQSHKTQEPEQSTPEEPAKEDTETIAFVKNTVREALEQQKAEAKAPVESVDDSVSEEVPAETPEETEEAVVQVAEEAIEVTPKTVRADEEYTAKSPAPEPIVAEETKTQKAPVMEIVPEEELLIRTGKTKRKAKPVGGKAFTQDAAPTGAKPPMESDPPREAECTVMDDFCEDAEVPHSVVVE